MSTVTSQDGTTIAYERLGDGPPVILVDGALCSRDSGPSRPLADALAERFSVVVYDRRGRGASGDRAPYAVEREVEDLAALLDAVGGSAGVYGISSGAVLALEAATRLDGITALALYEPPFVVDDTRAPIPADWGEHLRGLVDAGRRGDAVRYFLSRCVGLPRGLVWGMRAMPVWRKLKAVAHTLLYDAAVVGEGLTEGRWSPLAIPTVVIAGGKSPAWIRNGS